MVRLGGDGMLARNPHEDCDFPLCSPLTERSENERKAIAI
jgi:hypothetical protein